MSRLLSFLLLLLPISAYGGDTLISTNLSPTHYQPTYEPVTAPTIKRVRPIAKQQWNYLTKLWLARSCVGEAGFHAREECVGIAWTMATRAQDVRSNFLSVLQQYSAAIKPHERHRRPWIFQLTLNGDRPKDWPERLSWKTHKILWLRLLTILDKWANGKLPNPVEGANHFGGKMDTPGATWIEITPRSEVVFRNKFYRQTR